MALVSDRNMRTEQTAGLNALNSCQKWLLE